MAFEKFDLTGKNTLITGAAGLLGKEHAASLLESGATVVLTDMSAVALEAASQCLSESYEPKRILSAVMDVTDPEAIDHVKKMLCRLGLRVDILVNNAAIDPKVKGDIGLVESSRLEHFLLDQWNLQVSVGLTGAFLCSQTFGTAMSGDGKGGVILNIASDLSILAPDQRLYHKKNVPD